MQGRVALDERAGKEVLAGFGIAVPKCLVIRDAREAAAVLAGLKPPLAVKVMSPDILHKSEARAVRLNLATGEELVAACMEVSASVRAYRAHARIDGFLV